MIKKSNGAGASRADGALRDALSILDKCKMYSDSITVQSVYENLSLADDDTLFKILECLCGGRFSRLLGIYSVS